MLFADRQLSAQIGNLGAQCVAFAFEFAGKSKKRLDIIGVPFLGSSYDCTAFL